MQMSLDASSIGCQEWFRLVPKVGYPRTSISSEAPGGQNNLNGRRKRWRLNIKISYIVCRPLNN